ncbi:MAG TPA: ATP-binding protein [Solirubrobacteraceae bacterium]
MSRLAIRDRVTLAAALTLAAGLAVITLAVMLLLAGRLNGDAASVLRARADAVLTTIEVSDGRVHVREPPNDNVLDQDTWVFDGTGPVERAPASAATQAAAAGLAGVRTQRTMTVGQTKLLAVPAYGSGARAGVGTVVVGVELVPYRHTERIALAGMILLDIFVLIVGSLVARRAVGVALRPVADMTAKAAEWSDHDLDQRFGLGAPRDELTGLSATLDALLARIGASIRHEQRLSAEVAHELNTPLSGLRAEAELALRPSATRSDLRDALHQVLRSTDRMATVIRTLLSAARQGADQSPGSSDAADALQAAADAVAHEASARDVELTIRLPDRSPLVAAERDMLAQALYPVLENAVRHASRSVEIALESRDGDAAFRISDDGPGVESSQRSRVFEPGASSNGGAGLGLALARRLARAATGDLVLLEGDRGACFELRIPAIVRWQADGQAPTRTGVLR